MLDEYELKNSNESKNKKLISGIIDKNKLAGVNNLIVIFFRSNLDF
jgi:hypothetical protein